MSWQNGNNNDNLPDLDKMIASFFNKLKGSNTGSGGTNNSTPSTSAILLISLLLGSVLYVAFGFYTVETGMNALVTRFGKYTRTEGPGLHWLPSFIEGKNVINVQQVASLRRESSMLTKDGNILVVPMTVQYIISDAYKFTYNAVNPEKSLEQVSDSALRDVVGHSTLDEVLTTGRTDVVSKARKIIEELVDYYDLGITISDVVLERVETPTKVKEAFNDAIKAKSDEEAIQNKAREYENKIIPQAEGKKARIIKQAEAYSQKKILEAEGEVAKFTALVPEYKLAPEVTRTRLYLQTMQGVLSNSSKVIVDQKNGSNVNLLPLDKLIKAKAQGDK